MPDDKTKKVPHDAKRVDVNDPDEVRYWCRKFHCSEKMLKKAVANVGVLAVDVENEVERLKEIKRLEEIKPQRDLGR